MKTFATGDKLTAHLLNEGMWSFAAYTATTTNLTIGTGGSITTKYCRFGTGELVFFNGYISFGTGAAITAELSITFPVTSAYSSLLQWDVGSWIFRDTSATAHYSGSIGVWDTLGTEFSFAGAWNGTSPSKRITTGMPVTVASGDRLSWSGWFQAA